MANKNNNNKDLLRRILLPQALDAAIERWSSDLKITRNEFMVTLLSRAVEEMDSELDEIWAKRIRAREEKQESAPDVGDVWQIEPLRQRPDPFEGMYAEEDGRDPFEGMYADDDITYE